MATPISSTAKDESVILTVPVRFFSDFCGAGLDGMALKGNPAIGLPHFGQAGAASLTSVPQSGHLIKAIYFPLDRFPVRNVA